MTQLFRNFSRLTLNKNIKIKKYNKIKIYTQCNLFFVLARITCHKTLIADRFYRSEVITMQTQRICRELSHIPGVQFKKKKISDDKLEHCVSWVRVT